MDFKLIVIVLFCVTQIDSRRISFKGMKLRLAKQKTQAFRLAGMGILAKELIVNSGDKYFSSLVESITEELDAAGYTLLDKSL